MLRLAGHPPSSCAMVRLQNCWHRAVLQRRCQATTHTMNRAALRVCMWACPSLSMHGSAWKPGPAPSTRTTPPARTSASLQVGVVQRYSGQLSGECACIPPGARGACPRGAHPVWFLASAFCRPPVLHIRLQGAGNDGGHRLLVLPGHHPPGRQGDAHTPRCVAADSICLQRRLSAMLAWQRPPAPRALRVKQAVPCGRHWRPGSVSWRAAWAST